jgi:hypothetical protein
LVTGQAFVAFVDERGMQAGRVDVPLAKPIAVSELVFAGITKLFFKQSGVAMSVDQAEAALEDRERRLLGEASQLRGVDEPESAAGFRVPLNRGS